MFSTVHNQRRKFDKSTLSTDTPSTSQDINRKDYKSGDDGQPALLADAQSYAYQPYHGKNSRVEFTNNVMVVYIKEDRVIGESSEPLKKELEQQVRNKEMRKGHTPDMPFANKKKTINDWFRK